MPRSSGKGLRGFPCFPVKQSSKKLLLLKLLLLKLLLLKLLLLWLKCQRSGVDAVT